MNDTLKFDELLDEIRILQHEKGVYLKRWQGERAHRQRLIVRSDELFCLSRRLLEELGGCIDCEYNEFFKNTDIKEQIQNNEALSLARVIFEKLGGCDDCRRGRVRIEDTNAFKGHLGENWEKRIDITGLKNEIDRLKKDNEDMKKMFDIIKRHAGCLT